MKIHLHSLELPGTAGTDIHNVTHMLEEAVARSGIGEGQVLVMTPGSTAAVTALEYEPGVLKDLERALEGLAPSGAEYAHNARWGDGNGYSHVRAALMKPSLALIVTGGRPVLGTWQQVVVLDFDNKPRRRKVLIQVMGEAE